MAADGASLAPQYLHNRFFGETLTLNYYGYRGDTLQYRAIGSYATKVERNVDLGYKDTAIGGGRYILALELLLERQGQHEAQLHSSLTRPHTRQSAITNG